MAFNFKKILGPLKSPTDEKNSLLKLSWAYFVIRETTLNCDKEISTFIQKHAYVTAFYVFE